MHGDRQGPGNLAVPVGAGHRRGVAAVGFFDADGLDRGKDLGPEPVEPGPVEVPAAGLAGKGVQRDLCQRVALAEAAGGHAFASLGRGDPVKGPSVGDPPPQHGPDVGAAGIMVLFPRPRADGPVIACFLLQRPDPGCEGADQVERGGQDRAQEVVGDRLGGVLAVAGAGDAGDGGARPAAEGAQPVRVAVGAEQLPVAGEVDDRLGGPGHRGLLAGRSRCRRCCGAGALGRVGLAVPVGDLAQDRIPWLVSQFSHRVRLGELEGAGLQRERVAERVGKVPDRAVPGGQERGDSTPWRPAARPGR